MRSFFTWLLVIGFIAGLGTRMAATYGAGHSCGHEHHHECTDGGGLATEHDHHEDGHGPGDHHHCGSCLHNAPLGVDHEIVRMVSAPDYTRARICHESARPPEGPFQALDKPPLI